MATSAVRYLSLKNLIYLVALALGLFHLYTAQFGILPGLQQRVIHITLVLFMAFLVMATKQDIAWKKYVDIFLALASGACGLYISIVDSDLAMRVGTVYTSDVVFGLPFIVLICIATKRLLGWPLVIVALVAMAYALYGHWLPGNLGHRPYDIDSITYSLALSTEGIFGSALAVSSTVIAIFVYFGAFLKSTGGTEAITTFSQAALGHVRGGPAKVAVIASALFGSLSGSAVANVAATGAVTIPLMKRTGYQPAFAGAVESVASSGGQIMPPIMGAAAFLMAELLGTSYVNIVFAAIFPAIFYFLAVFIQVDLEAAKLGLMGLPRSELPKLGASIKGSWHVFAPVVFLVVLLVVVGWTPVKAAFWSIVLLFALSILFYHDQVKIKTFLSALQEGSHGLLSVACACAISGIVIGVFSLTGLGLKFSGLLVYLSMGNVYLLLIFTMLASIILGMGMATLPCYLVLAVIVAPALTNMGIDPLAAHLFIFYFGIISGITPPVCVAAFAGAAIAESDPVRTGFMALRLGIAALIMPYMFVFGPGLLLKGSIPTIILAVVSAACGIVALAISMEGYIKGNIGWLSRLLLLGAALVLIKQGWASDLIGFIVFVGVVFFHLKKAGKGAPPQATDAT